MADYNTFSLKEMCHVCTNENGDSFVGVKIDEKKAIVSFPLGYCLPEDDATLRKEIRALLRILYLFGEKEATPLRGLRIIENHSLGFPVQAYLDIIDYYIENNGHYYVETEKRYKTDTKGKINWPKTIKKQRSFIIEGSPIYSHFEIEYKNPSKNQLITIINKFCVFHAFQRLGWLYTNQQIDNPGIAANDGTLRMFLQELHKKNGTINKDRDKRLFKSMITMIKFLDNRLLNAGFTFGSDTGRTGTVRLFADPVHGQGDDDVQRLSGCTQGLYELNRLKDQGGRVEKEQV